MLGLGLVRKATKVVIYTAIPVAGPLKAATMGTRRGNLNRKEVRKQTQLLQQMQAQQQGTYMTQAEADAANAQYAANRYALPQPPPMPPPL